MLRNPETGGWIMRRHVLSIFAILLLTCLIPVAQVQGQTDQVIWSYTGPMAEDGTWDIQVTAPRRYYSPGDRLTLGVDFTLNSLGLSYNMQRIEGIYTLVTGSRVFDEDGLMIGTSHAMASPLLTGIGLPIEGESFGLPTDRFGGPFHHPIDSYELVPSGSLEIDTQTGTIHGTAVHGIYLDPGIPPGHYQLRIDIGLEVTGGNIVTLWGEDPTLPHTTREEQSYVVTSPIAVASTSQPQMIWTLFSQSLPSGGAVAIEDQGRIACSRGTGFSSRIILPMTAPQGGQARYLLEPDFPLVWNPFMREVGTQLDLDYHSGWMEVRIENPDGSIVDLGGAQFAGRRGMGATTLQERFAYSFSSYGRHRIELSGWIKDSAEQVYTGGGVYEVYVGKQLEIETNVLSGTPFKINDHFDTGFQVYPPMPAEVQILWEIDYWSRGSPSRGGFTAHANRWGYFSPPIIERRNRATRGTRIQWGDPGEYRVTFQASYREPDGTQWLGEKVITGIVYPDNPIDLASRPPSLTSFSITSDARYHPVPADSGDTLLIPVPTSPELPTIYTFPVGFFLDGQIGFRIDDAALQELPGGAAGKFVVPRIATGSGLFPQMYPEDIDRRAYLVSTAVRSDGAEQSRVGEGNPIAHLPYPVYPWRPGGIPPDAPGDIYHFWSGMAYRDLTNNSTRYGYYTAGGVVTDITSVPRLHVPGSPLVSDGWGTHSLLLHNLAVRPGSIVSNGTPFTPGAYYLPLPINSAIEFTVTPPQGDQIRIAVPGDNRGYACDMGQRFNLNQTGIWTVESRLIQGNETGGILGVNPGEPWEFYVIDRGNDNPIRFHRPFQVPLQTDDGRLVLTGDVLDSGILEGTVYISTTFTGRVVEQTSRPIMNGGFVYSIDLLQVSNSYSNFDPEDPNDRLDISFFATGLTAGGSRRQAARLTFLQGGTLYAGEKDYSSIDPQTREERLRELAELAESELARELRGRVPSEDESE